MRIKFGGMFSTFTETTNIRLNGWTLKRRTRPFTPASEDHGRREALRKGDPGAELLARV